MIKKLALMNENIEKFILAHAPRNIKYTSPIIQKNILNIIANNLGKKICDEVEDAKFCILLMKLMNHARNRWQLLYDFFNSDVFVKETTSSNLKIEICWALI